MISREKVKQEVSENLTIEWMGRRSITEIVEEFTDSVFWGSFIYFIYTLIGGFLPVSFAYVVVFLIVATFLPFYIELEKWANEWHIVARDDLDGGGVVYKVWGVLSKSKKISSITKMSPSISTYTSFWYILWGYLTGDQMEKVTLTTDTHTHMDGQRISPSYAKAVGRIKQYKGGKAIKDVQPLWQILDGLNRAKTTDLLDPRYASHVAKVMTDRMLYDDN